jgi:hypothetical protein
VGTEAQPVISKAPEAATIEKQRMTLKGKSVEPLCTKAPFMLARLSQA